MRQTRSAQQVLDEEFLALRAKVLEIAAGLDRLERAAGDLSADPRAKNLHKSLEILQSGHANRAEQVQLLFSRNYEANWPEELDLPLEERG